MSPKIIGALTVVAAAGAFWWYLDSLHDTISELETKRDELIKAQERIISERDFLGEQLADASQQLADVQARAIEAERLSLERERQRQRLDELNAKLTAEIRQLRVTDESVDIYLNSHIPDALYQRMQQRAAARAENNH